MRLLCADTHPDHDTICTFRRAHRELLARSFAQVIELSARCGVLRVGGITVALDGTKALASASRHAAVSHGRAGERMRELDLEIDELLKKADAADSAPLEDGLSIPEQVQRRQERKAQLAKARAEIEARARARAASEREDYERKVAARDAARAAGKKPRGKEPQPPEETPAAKDQYNFTDPESRIMPVSGGGFEQSYNAQAAVEIESRLIVGQHVSDAPNDKQQLEPGVCVRTAAGGARYKLRQQTVEPVFGIIKSALGFRGFRLRGKAGAALEWTLVTLAYNLRRLHRLGAQLKAA